MKKVLVLNPPSPDESYINRDLMGGMGVKSDFGKDIASRLLSRIKSNLIKIPVIQLVYGATLLKMHGFDVKVMDSVNENKTLNDIMPEIKAFNPDYVLMAISSACFMYERDVVAAAIKKECNNPKIIVVGDMITEMPEQLVPNFDIGIMGEVENNIIDICNGKNPREIVSVIYKDEKDVKHTAFGKRLEKERLEELPMPDWSLWPYQKYRYMPMITAKPVATILASRGCPYGCGYCPYTKNQGAEWRARSGDSIYAEVENDVKKYGFKGFFFRDPLFSLDFKRVERLCELIVQNKLKIKFVFETRPELLTRPLIDKLHQAGCRAINFGVEDIHPEILQKINRRPVRLEKIEEIVSYCEEVGIRTSCFFILGLPGSTRETIAETIAWSLKLFPSQIEYKVATPFPGTELYYMAKNNGWLVSESFDHLGGYSAAMQISPELSPDYLEGVSSKAFKTFYFRPRYIMRDLMRGRLFINAYYSLAALI